MKTQRSTMCYTKKTVKIIINILLFLLFISCADKSTLLPFEMGEQLRNEEMIVKDSFKRVKAIKRAFYKYDTTVTLYVYGSKNTLYHLIKDGLKEEDIQDYINYFNKKFDTVPEFIDQDTIANDFISSQYKWNNPNGDIAIVASWRNIHDTAVPKNNWNIEIWNDTLLESTRNVK